MVVVKKVVRVAPQVVRGLSDAIVECRAPGDLSQGRRRTVVGRKRWAGALAKGIWDSGMSFVLELESLVWYLGGGARLEEGERDRLSLYLDSVV